MSMMRKVFLYVREVKDDVVRVDLADFPRTVEVPRDLFSDDVLKALKKAKPGMKLTGFANRTRMESKLAIAGPFEIALEATLEGERVVHHMKPIESHPRSGRLPIVDIWTCKTCRADFCTWCSPQDKHTCPDSSRVADSKERLKESGA